MADVVDVALAVVVEPAPAPAPQAWRVLITRRPAESVYGGYWELPGGKCEPGESLAACVAREMKEELDLAVTVGEALDPIEHRYAHAHVRLHPFVCRRAVPDAAPRAVGVSEFRWVGPGEIEHYRFPPANVLLIARIKQLFDSPQP